jgi:predicted metalloprotease with PDZ domain
MKRHFFLSLFIIFSTYSFAQNQYQYQIDLLHVTNDQVKVTLTPPKMDKAELLFVMPRVIPGSYSIKNYGRFIKQFTAFDTNGKKLKTKQKEINEFYIYNAGSIGKIEYYVNDTWDDKDKKSFVFQPGGSNIEAGLNYVINPHCFFGYFDGFKMNPIQIEVKKPAEMYGSGNLTKSAKDNITDIIEAPNYVFLADNPIMYCVPDTTSFQVAAANIHISVYSVNGIVKSKKVAEYLQPVAGALKEFLKDLPVSEYHFLYYFDDPERLQTSKSKGLSGGYGALEHNHSSFYYLPESRYEKKLVETVKHVSSHEFLHLVTPLNLHSEEIEHFDFLHPKMSKHLWMYEGVTEYFSYLAQIRGNIITEKDFRKEIRTDSIEALNLAIFL